MKLDSFGPRHENVWGQEAATSKALLSGENAGVALSSVISLGYRSGQLCASLSSFCGSNSAILRCLGQRMALSAATVIGFKKRLIADEASLRDLWYLRSDAAEPGPAGEILAAFRALVADRDPLRLEVMTRAAEALGTPFLRADLEHLLARALELREAQPIGVIAASEIAASVVKLNPRSEIFGLWLADAVFADHLKLPVAFPLLASQWRSLSVKEPNGGRRHVSPLDPAWSLISLQAYSLAIGEVLTRGAELSRRGEALIDAQRKLRAKGAASVVSMLLADDAVPASVRLPGITDRGSRRLFERLSALGLVRELTGRSTFRLYGL